jgi:glycosyltransferase involved in cell wall biosynthesis
LLEKPLIIAMQDTPKKKLIRTAATPGSLFGLLKGQLAFLNQYYEVVGVASEGHLLQKLEEEQGIRTMPVNIKRDISPLKDLVSLYNLYRLFKKEKPFMVHSITPKAGLLSMTAAYFAGVPRRIHTFTGLLFPTQKGIMKRVLLYFDKLICRFATHVYPEGNGVRRDLENYRVTRKPLKVIANGNVNGVDLGYFDPDLYNANTISLTRQEYGLDQEDFVFVNVCRLVNDKGINELVGAFCRLARDNSGIKLVLVGGSKGESDLLPRETLDTIEAHDQIIALGARKDVRPFLSMADAFVFPSYREGFPNVVLEAGAMGLPAIVTDINGSNEIIVEGKNGVIIPPKDETALLQAMQTFIKDRSLLKRLAKVARPMIVNRFERSAVWDAVLEEYKQIEAMGD